MIGYRAGSRHGTGRAAEGLEVWSVRLAAIASPVSHESIHALPLQQASYSQSRDSGGSQKVDGSTLLSGIPAARLAFAGEGSRRCAASVEAVGIALISNTVKRNSGGQRCRFIGRRSRRAANVERRRPVRGGLEGLPADDSPVPHRATTQPGQN